MIRPSGSVRDQRLVAGDFGLDGGDRFVQSHQALLPAVPAGRACELVGNPLMSPRREACYDAPRVENGEYHVATGTPQIVAAATEARMARHWRSREFRVADFSRLHRMTLCSLILADLGAEVIKIEKADGGDDFRRLRPPITEQEGAPAVWAKPWQEEHRARPDAA